MYTTIPETCLYFVSRQYNQTHVRNHVKLGISPRILYCGVDTGYGLGGSLRDCLSALPKGRKYQMVKIQTESHDWRTIVWTNRWQIWVSFSYEVCQGRLEFVKQVFGDSTKLSSSGLAITRTKLMFRICRFIQKRIFLT